MGKYRATINMPEAKRYAVAEFPDNEPRVIRMVLDGHLIPVDVAPEVTAQIEEAKIAPPVTTGGADAVRAALQKARDEEQARKEAESDAIDAADVVEDEPVTTSFTPDAVAPATSAYRSKKG